MIKREELLAIGFKELPHQTVGGMLIYELGRHRHLTISCVGTPNEMLFISESDINDYRKITDSICLKNFDYDGFMKIEDVKALVNLLKA